MKVHQNGTLPQNGEVFVFGSNLAGRHGAGAARVAYEKFGAIMGKGCGMQGQSYAIPTKNENIISMDMFSIKAHVDQFCKFVLDHQELNFFLTAVGCGLAHKSHKEMASLFTSLTKCDNISIPHDWEPHLLGVIEWV